MSEGFLRCPRCGNENRSESFSCSFCGKRLRIEKIESYRYFKNFFQRIESEWIAPNPWYLNIIYLFIDPARAFWDINHKRSNSPGYYILIFNSLLWGLMGLAFMSHFRFVSTDEESINPNTIALLLGLIMFLTFLIFGFIFQTILYLFLIWLFTLGANYTVGFSEKLEERFGKEKKEKYKESDISPFSIYKSGTLLQKQQANKYKMLMCAFAPFLLINTIKIFIILIAFPTVEVDISNNELDPSVFNKMFNSPVWAVLDVIDALTIAIWVPILMTIAIRELGNTSTTRVLISSLSIGIVFAIVFYFLRPTLFGI